MDTTNGNASFAVSAPVDRPRTRVVQIKGALDAHACRALRPALATVLEDATVTGLYLRMEAAVSADDDGLALLADLYDTLHQRGGTVELHGCRPAIVELLEQTRLIHLFRVVP